MAITLDELGEAFRAEIGPRRFADFANVAAEIRAALATEADLAEGAEASSPRSTAAALTRSTPRDQELRAIASLLEEKLGAEAAGRLGRILCP